MSTLDKFFSWAWENYLETTPQAADIKELLEAEGETVCNDHIALRTFDHPSCAISKLSKFFLEAGYLEGGSYLFPNKKVEALHFYHPDNSSLPKIFISQLKYGEFSEPFVALIEKLIAQIDSGPSPLDLLKCGRPWQLSFAEYQLLAAESEYGSWMAGHGFRINHFTVDVNQLKKFGQLPQLNSFLLEKGFELNNSGGAIKGRPELFLEQSSTMASDKEVDFSDGRFPIPGCYYEFAKRYPLPNGQLFQGFVAASADKIFESTDKTT
ncbi:MAG: DUF1338 domain-containing protein [Halobacteriovoraceae bacterium]|nr:DUF1338 domain-containing protein [Halobacteriovoraceae bacterium]